MKRYLHPEMDIELFEGADLYLAATNPQIGGGGCAQDFVPPCGDACGADSDCGSDDLDWNPNVCFNITLGGDEGPGI